MTDKKEKKHSLGVTAGFNPVLNIAHGAILLFIFELQLVTFNKNLIGNMTVGLRISLLALIINRTFKGGVHTL